MEGKRDVVTVNTWLFQVEQYLYLIAVCNPEADIFEVTKVLNSFSLFRETATSWWYMLTQIIVAPDTWKGFKDIVKVEFIPADSDRRAKDRLRTFYQSISFAP